MLIIDNYQQLIQYILKLNPKYKYTANEIIEFALDKIKNNKINFKSFKFEQINDQWFDRFKKAINSDLSRFNKYQFSELDSIFNYEEQMQAKRLRKYKICCDDYLKNNQYYYDDNYRVLDKICYYYVRSGENRHYQEECYNNGYIGICWDIDVTLSNYFELDKNDLKEVLYDTFHSNNKCFKNKRKTSWISSQIWCLLHDINDNQKNIVVMPYDKQFLIGEICSKYVYDSKKSLPHCRKVKWFGIFDIYDLNGKLKTIIEKHKSDQRSLFLLDFNSNINCDYGEIIEMQDDMIEDVIIDTNDKNNKFLEKDMHPCLQKFLYKIMNIVSMTIDHTKSKKTGISEDWTYPDMIGIKILNYDQDILELAQRENNAYGLCSYELKLKIDNNNIRECYFQAIANSSWAHQGYLVVKEIIYDNDNKLRDEIHRLHNLFGIGIIHLNCSLDLDNKDIIEKSEIILPAEKRALDLDSINKLFNINEDFKFFIKEINLIIKQSNSFTFKQLIDRLKKFVDNK